MTEEMLSIQESVDDPLATASSTTTAPNTSSLKDSPFVFISRKPTTSTSSSTNASASAAAVVLHPPQNSDRLSAAEAGNGRGEGGGGATAATSWESCFSNPVTEEETETPKAPGTAITTPAQVHASPKVDKKEGLKRTKERHLRDR